MMRVNLAAMVLVFGAGFGGDQLRAQTLSHGEAIFVRECAKCHQVGPQAKNRVGPQLNDLFGRKAGAVVNYKNYSEATRNAGFVWSPENFRQFIKDPRGMIIGTTQVYNGLENDDDITALIEFLQLQKATP